MACFRGTLEGPPGNPDPYSEEINLRSQNLTRQILTCNDDPSTERIKIFIMAVDT